MTRVEFLRREQGLTQKQLANMVNEWRNNLSDVERGARRPWPRLRKSLAEALGVREEDLFDETGDCKQVDWTIPTERRSAV